MRPLKAIAVDDEPHALDLLKLYAEKSTLVELGYTTVDPWKAKEVLEKEEFDLIFLDIQMPELTGLQLLDVTSKKLNVILTSAYPQYALEGYRYEVKDYLLKPFSFERFEEAVRRVKERSSSVNPNEEKDHLILKGDGKGSFHKLRLGDLRYIEGMRNHAAFFHSSGRLVSLTTLTEIEKALPPRFMRIHRSFIVDLEKIDRIEGNTVYLGEKGIPIGKTYRKDVFEVLGI